MNLTEKQEAVLAILAARAGHENTDGPLTGPEIGEIQFRHLRVKAGVKEWAAPALKQLETKGLVEKLGTGPGNARCWKINDAGLEAHRIARINGAQS